VTEGYAIALAPCWVCGVVFGFHPHRVPSFPDRQGVRQPVCEPCMAEVNHRRALLGLDPFDVLEGAYEPLEEGQL
jgi:hypothetical protein